MTSGAASPSFPDSSDASVSVDDDDIDDRVEPVPTDVVQLVPADITHHDSESMAVDLRTEKIVCTTPANTDITRQRPVGGERKGKSTLRTVAVTRRRRAGTEGDDRQGTRRCPVGGGRELTGGEGHTRRNVAVPRLRWRAGTGGGGQGDAQQSRGAPRMAGGEGDAHPKR